jgi:hypothetical protein
MGIGMGTAHEVLYVMGSDKKCHLKQSQQLVQNCVAPAGPPNHRPNLKCKLMLAHPHCETTFVKEEGVCAP